MLKHERALLVVACACARAQVKPKMLLIYVASLMANATTDDLMRQSGAD